MSEDLPQYDVEVTVRMRLQALSTFEAKAVAVSEIRKRVPLRVLDIEATRAERSDR